MNQKTKFAALLMIGGLCLAVMFAAMYPLQAQSGPSGTNAKSAIVGKVALSATSKTLTAYCKRDQAFLFKGYIAFDPNNAGASNVLKATIDGASDVTAEAGSVKDWSAVNSDLVIITGVATDYINIVGEDVEVDQARPGTY